MKEANLEKGGTVWYVRRDRTEWDEAFRPTFGAPKTGTNFGSASPLVTTCSTSMEHKIITSQSPSSSLFPSEGIFAPSPFHLVPSRPVPFRSVPSHPVCIPNDT
ncbi:hypothetical protein DVH24_016545 [Malus domestica]|uniref:Uncharacterized protein n=1 Tax=Malus domestica TaxID=3750 RepID=A0A498HXU6_MALDO|nr:hypothetical protein DVH24_016545 [Malus domestica]